jgi:RpiB/LacA/LacB family sugar-phosphate isomerase
MKIVIGSDHAGFALKNSAGDLLRSLGHQVLDGRAERGVLICGSGVGASVAANKLIGIRAAVCHDTYSAHQGVEHDDMNVLVLGSRVIGVKLAEDLVKSYLGAKFTNEERHMRRIAKIRALEAKSAAAGRV